MQRRFHSDRSTPIRAITRGRDGRLAAALAPLGLVFWLACADPGESGSGVAQADDQAPLVEEGAAGSALPCAAPLAWRIVRVDAEFGVARSAVDEALRRAIAEWERASGRALFSIDSSAGSPIRLVYDERQARGEERRRLVDEMREVEEGLEMRRTRLERRMQDGSTYVSQHEARWRDLQARVAAHNDVVRSWNERGGAPPDVQRRLRAAGNALDLETQELRQELERVEETRRQIEADQERYEADVAEYNRVAADIDARYPPSRVESGIYREAIRSVRGRAASASRQILIYRFANQNDLVRVLAHELGHSIGLGHVAVSGALMSEDFGPAGVQSGPLIVQEDLDELYARCPALFEG